MSVDCDFLHNIVRGNGGRSDGGLPVVEATVKRQSSTGGDGVEFMPSLTCDSSEMVVGPRVARLSGAKVTAGSLVVAPGWTQWQKGCAPSLKNKFPTTVELTIRVVVTDVQ